MRMPTTIVGLILVIIMGGAGVGSNPSDAQSFKDRLKAIGREGRGAGVTSEADTSLEQALLKAPTHIPLDVIKESCPVPEGVSKIATNLLQLVEHHQTKGLAQLADKAEELNIPYANGRASVRVFAETAAAVASLRASIEAAGGDVVATFDNVIYARLPLSSIKSMESMNALYFMGAEPVDYPLASRTAGGDGTRVSEGVTRVQVERLHQAGITGKQVKVGILDFGFQHYDALLKAGKVPQPRAQRAFNKAQRMEGDGEVHGTACAEIVADMAPDAELYLAAIDGEEGQFVAAAQWLAQQKVDIISYSGGGYVGPHNGRSIKDRLVADIVSQHNILWVNAASNDGDKHWMQLARDDNNNQLIDSIDPRYPDSLVLKTTGGPFAVTVVWDDWGPDPRLPSARQDIDAFLLARQASGEWRPIAASCQVQNGRGEPVEGFVAHGDVPAGQVLRLALHLKRVDRPVRTHVFVQGGGLFSRVPNYSIGIPATSEAALAVGAVDVRKDQLEQFSSQGPTDDERQKPEVSAPDNTLSVAYSQGGRAERFQGTSAAAPHVSGFAALLKQLQPDLSPSALRQAVISYVTAKGDKVPNYQYGYGRIDAGKVNLERPASRAGSDEGFERAIQGIIRGQR